MRFGASQADAVHDEEQSEGGDETNMLPYHYGINNIVKTTDYNVVRSEPRQYPNRAPKNLSDEILIPDAAYFVSKG